MKIKFEDEFSDFILKRGLEYYKLGHVKKVEINDGIVTAVVQGTSDYYVSLEIIDNDFFDCYCDCPYFSEHDQCKHITALLYYLNKENINDNSLKYDETISFILDKINKEDLKAFLVELLENDENIYDLFRRKFIEYFPKISSSEYKKKIENAICVAGGRDGFIDYNEAYDYKNKMYEFINEAEYLASKKDYETAFCIVKIILDSIPNTSIDDSNGETGEVADCCIDVIINILCDAASDNKIIKKIFDYVVLEIKTNRLKNYGIELYNLIENFISSELFLDECEKVLIDAINDCDDSKWYSYIKKYYLDYLKELYDKTDDKVKKMKLIEDNLDEINIFQEYIEILMNEKTINEIVQNLNKYRKKYPNYKKYISDKLLEIYENNNFNLEYKKELYDAFFDYDKFNFEKYIKIKRLFDEKDWRNEVEDIISKVKKSTTYHYEILTKIFIEEKMIDRLFELVRDKNDINYYEEYLLPKYRDELIEINIKKCEKTLKFSSNRREYSCVAEKLKYIKKIDINKKYINKFIELIRERYANKPALMDEISKI